MRSSPVAASSPSVSTRAWPDGFISSSRAYSENRRVAGSRPAAAHFARTSSIRSRISAARRNTKLSSSANRTA